jgi:hypothetical protein
VLCLVVAVACRPSRLAGPLPDQLRVG